MRYHIVKASRNYCGRPYCGPTSEYKPAEAEHREVALDMARGMTFKNPVGFDVYDTQEGCYVEDPQYRSKLSAR